MAGNDETEKRSDAKETGASRILSASSAGKLFMPRALGEFHHVEGNSAASGQADITVGERVLKGPAVVFAPLSAETRAKIEELRASRKATGKPKTLPGCNK